MLAAETAAASHRERSCMALRDGTLPMKTPSTSGKVGRTFTNGTGLPAKVHDDLALPHNYAPGR